MLRVEVVAKVIDFALHCCLVTKTSVIYERIRLMGHSWGRSGLDKTGSIYLVQAIHWARPWSHYAGHGDHFEF